MHHTKDLRNLSRNSENVAMYAIHCISGCCRRVVLLLALPVFLFTRSLSQEIILDPPPVTSPVNTLSIGDIDLLNATSPQWLFTIAMRTRDGSTIRAKMTLRLRIQLPGGELVPSDGSDALIISTRDPHFLIPGSRAISNVDFGKTIPTASAKLNQQARQRLEEIALPSGTVPAGVYQFLVEVSPIAGGAVTTGTFSIVITNPSSVELVFPLDGDEVTPLPVFQWMFDGSRSRISVYEKLPGQAGLEETASGTPHLQTVVPTASYQYPASGVRALEPGKSYVWFVEGLVPASGGSDRIIRSQPRSFTVSSKGLGLSDLLADLEQALGTKYKGVFTQIRAAGFSPAGGPRLNGATLSKADLAKLLNMLRSNPEKIATVVLE